MKTNWQTKRLGEVVSIVTGKLDANAAVDNGEFPFYTCSQGDYSINETAFDGESILLSGNGIFTVKYHKSGKFNAYQRVYVIQSKTNEIYLKYIYFFLVIEVPKLISQGGVIKYLRLPQLTNLEIPLPPLKIQKEIVAKLDAKFAKLREAKRLREEALADTEKILSQTLREIFEEGKQKGWEETSVGDTCSLMTGATPSTSRRDYYGGDIKWLVSGDIHNKEIFDCEGRINELGVKNSNAKLLPKNSLLIALNGQGKTKGTVSILRVEATCNQSLVAIIPSSNVLVEYLYYCLHFQYKKIRGMAGDDSRKGLNMKIVREISFLLPTLHEQQKIITKLDKLSEKVRTLRELQTSQLADLKRLEKSYLREAFNGELA